MADFTVSIPDALMVSVAAAAQRINERLPVDQRLAGPFDLTSKDIEAFVKLHILQVLQSDLEQNTQEISRQTISTELPRLQTDVDGVVSK